MIPRKVYTLGNVKSARNDAVLCKYMDWWKFEFLVNERSLYFRRIDKFDDQLEGSPPQAIWTLSAPPIQDWYRANREDIFVCCLHLGEGKSAKMWKEYAANNGVMIRSTVSALREELSFPGLVAEPTYAESTLETAAAGIASSADAITPRHDGFTVGVVDYVDFDNIDVYELLAEGLSNTTPMFRKAKGYIDELEYRAILRPGSVTGEVARLVPVRKCVCAGCQLL